MRRLDPAKADLVVVDVQERLFPLVDRSDQIARSMVKVIQGCKVLGLPIHVTEQYPRGLGTTIDYLQEVLGPKQKYVEKTAFSAAGALPAMEQVILVGIEAHVCILQTAIDLVEAGCDVIVLTDAISSRSVFDFSSALGELRDIGARLSSVESVLFEMVGDSANPHFKPMSTLLKHA